MWHKMSQFCAAAFSGAVVAVVSATALGIVAALLAVPEHPLLTRPELIMVCIVVGAYGLIGAGSEVWSTYRKKQARDLLVDLILVGIEILGKHRGAMTEEINRDARTWIGDVNNLLMKYLDTNCVKTFNAPVLMAKSNPESHPEWIEQGEIFMRVQRLDQLVSTLK